MDFISDIISWLYGHPEVTWSGSGIAFLTFCFGVFRLFRGKHSGQTVKGSGNIVSGRDIRIGGDVAGRDKGDGHV